MTRRDLAVRVAAVVVLVVLVVAIVVADNDDDPLPAPSPTASSSVGKAPGNVGPDPVEDDPAWSCVLHGNRRCEP